ncbi:MAG: polysaccharide deacetylase [Desulfarculus sp.]|nr:polysaccharide deacetylase [Desulfarculus sp.]
MKQGPPLNLLITVDTELSHSRREDLASRLEAVRDRDVFGRTPQGDFGLAYILERLQAHGLKATFFLEAFYGLYAGAAELGSLVELVASAGQEVALHLHSEWLELLDLPRLAGLRGDNLKDFSRQDQQRLIALGLEVMGRAGAGPVKALRAGNYGANLDTLAAAAQNGLSFETSYNPAYLGGACQIALPQPLWQPMRLEGVWELPVSAFRDYPGHLRPLQLSACSLGELTHAITQAAEWGWPCLVLVMHSFELIQRRHLTGLEPRADAPMLRRFEGLCQFLAARRQQVRTCHFAGIATQDLERPQLAAPLSSHPGRTLWRLAQQVWRRLDSRRK